MTDEVSYSISGRVKISLKQYKTNFNKTFLSSLS